MGKPKALILGGVGFVGRNLVKYLVDNDLCEKIRVVDKVLPSTAFLGDEHQKAFDNPTVEYMQGNLTSESSIKNCYTKGMDGDKFNIVFNLAAETKYGQTEEVYKEKVLDLATKVGKEAVEQKVDRFIQVSHGQVYEAKKNTSDESGKTAPWTNLAIYCLKAEEELKKMDLNLVILRPACIYGPGDVNGISPRLIVGAVYKHLDEKMKLLWSSDLKLNTVHVIDVAAALWALSSDKVASGTMYNIADKNETDQGKINAVLEKIFGISTGFHGTALSTVAKTKIKSVTETVNDKHLKPWSELCKAAGILNTPLTPYLDQELLMKNNLSINGSAIESLDGFEYKHPNMTEDLIRDQIDYYVKQNLFPKI